jgi:hypothetical protein
VLPFRRIRGRAFCRFGIVHLRVAVVQGATTWNGEANGFADQGDVAVRTEATAAGAVAAPELKPELPPMSATRDAAISRTTIARRMAPSARTLIRGSCGVSMACIN